MSELMKFTKVSVQLDFALALTNTGSIIAWGDDGNYNKVSNTPIGEGHTDIYAGWQNAFAIDNGNIVVWGDSSVLDSIPTHNDYIQVVGVDRSGCGLRSNGDIVMFGSILSDESWVNPQSTSDFKYISVQNSVFVGIKNNGQLVHWGHNHDSYYRNVKDSVLENTDTFKYIHLGPSNILGIKEDGYITGWHVFLSSSYNFINNIPDDDGYIKVISSTNMAYGLKSNGSVVEWGATQSPITLPYNDIVDISIDFYGSILFMVTQSGNIIPIELGNVTPKNLLTDTPGYISDDPVPPEVSVNNTTFTTHTDPITINITTSNPNSDKYKITRTLTRSDNVEIFNKSTDFELSHPVIQEILTPRTNTLPIEKNKPMTYTLEIIVENEAGEIAVEEVSITITNNIPTISVDSSNKGYIDIDVSDSDKDQLVTKVIYNYGESNQKTLKTFVSMINVENNNFRYYFNPGDLEINESNNIRIVTEDPFFGEVYEDIIIEGEYIGIIFYDDNGTPYNDDLNNILKYIEFDNMSFGDISDPITIKLSNNTNRDLSSINISPESQISNIEFSLNGIDWDNGITLSNIQVDEVIDIFIRLNIINSTEYNDITENIKILGTI